MALAVPCSSLSLVMAAAWAALPSRVLVSGTPWRRIAFVKNRLAACSSPCAVSRTSMRWPVLSTARARVPVAFHLHGRLVQAPTDPPRALAAMKHRFQLGTVFDHSALDRRVVDRHPTLLQQCFDMPTAAGIRHRPAHAQEKDLGWEMGPPCS